MLPILDYHFEPYRPPINSILDDNIERIGCYLPSMPTDINSLQNFQSQDYENECFIIGAIDSSRSLIKRTQELNMPNVFSIFQSLI